MIEKKAFIGGRWGESESGERMKVRSPIDGSVLGTVPRCTQKDVDKAVAAAVAGQRDLSRLSTIARVGMLHEAQKIAERRGEEAAKLLSQESGKTITEARGCAGPRGYSWANYRIAAENLRSFRGMTLQNNTFETNDKRVIVGNCPIGVVVNISTFSYPSEMPNVAVPFALALGNAVIVKPSQATPFSSLLIAEIIEEAGFPVGSMSVLTGAGKEIGEALVAHPGVGAVNLFGQLETAREVTQRAGLKKLLLAVVSNNPMIVMDDANLDAAVHAALRGSFSLAGQGPISTGTILVHKNIHREFVESFVERTKRLRLLNALDEDADVGPMNNETVLRKALQHLEDARHKGGKILAGGSNNGLYFTPTVIDDASPDMAVVQLATPGPIAPIMTFGTADEAVDLANATQYGFQASVFTGSLKNAFFLSEAIQAGGVYVNEATNCWDMEAAFGGVKNSGLGRMLGRWGLEQFSEPKMTMMDLSPQAD